MNEVSVNKEVVAVSGCDLEVITVGDGQPVLALHGGNGPFGAAPFVKALGARHRVIVPSHPGFGYSSRPDHVDKIDDVAYVYLDLLETLDLRDVVVMGFSIGGWIAAEIATKCLHRIAKVVMVGAVGIKLGDRETRDFPDVFAMSAEQLSQLAFHDPEKAKIDFSAMSDETLRLVSRNRETFALYAWEPYLHNPKLLSRLHRITVPALFLWGESDGLVRPEYGRRYSEIVPHGEFDIVARAGHAPHLEQPHSFTQRVLEFLAS